MQPRTPTQNTNQDLYNKSVAKVLSGNVSPGNGLTFDPSGQPLSYSPDNMSGIIIRVGSLSNLNGLPAHWIAANTDLTLVHNLNRVPYGFVVIAKWAAADVFYGTIAATATTITLQCNSVGTDTTIWILA